MFRFSIRELLLVMSGVGLCIGWGLDHARQTRLAATRERAWRTCTLQLGEKWSKSCDVDIRVVTPDGKTFVFVGNTDMLDKRKPLSLD